MIGLRGQERLPGPEPSPCPAPPQPAERGSHPDRDLTGRGKPAAAGTWRRGWGRCELAAAPVLGEVTWSRATGKSQLRPRVEECCLRFRERQLRQPEGTGEAGGVLAG